MADIGVTRLELCSPIGYGADFASLAIGNEVRKILADHGMKAESCHFSMRELRERQPEEHRLGEGRRHHADDHGHPR